MNRAFALLSGEATTLPEAEARSLFLAYDNGSRLRVTDGRVVVAETTADPFAVGSRVAFSRRVGLLFAGLRDAVDFLGERRARLRVFDLDPGLRQVDPEQYLRGYSVNVDLREPELELTVIRGAEEYVGVTNPLSMNQGWSQRRPRKRAFFHPSAIFPKLSRAMVNLTRCLPGEIFLDPFSGTGSIPIEAGLIGARVVAVDRSLRMAAGSMANMKHFSQNWLGVVRADANVLPLSRVYAIATDVPYGRASSTEGKRRSDVVTEALAALPKVMNTGGRLVLMHAEGSRSEIPPSLELEEEHHLYVHKLLTRTISVLRRR